MSARPRVDGRAEAAPQTRVAVASYPAPSDSCTADDGRDADASLRQEVARLKEQIAALAPLGDAQPAQVSAQDFAEMRRQLAELQRNSAATDEPPIPNRAEEERNRQAHIASLEASFWQEPGDPKWSDKASAAVLEALETGDTDTIEVRGLECRSHTCRVELANDTPQALNGLPIFFLRLAETLPDTVASQVDNVDGTRSTVLYMSNAA
jgi:hypothetical protein